MPFREFTGSQPGKWWEIERWWEDRDRKVKPEIVLRQVEPNSFQLVRGFRYALPKGARLPRDKKRREFNVFPHRMTANPSSGDNRTDLASVPSWLWWFIASHGRHSRAALLHDQLVDDPKVKNRDADHAFRLALGESDVPILRRWLMWDAVSLASLGRRGFEVPPLGGRIARLLGVAFVGIFALYTALFLGALAYSLQDSWSSVGEVLARPILLLWSGLERVASFARFGWVPETAIPWLWVHVPGVPGMGDPWSKTSLLGVFGFVVWRVRFPLTIIGVALIALPTLTVLTTRLVVWLLEAVLWLVAKLASWIPGIDIVVSSPGGWWEPFSKRVGRM